MNQVARVFVVINLLLSAGFMMAAATFLKQNEDWKKQHETVSEEKVQLTAQKDQEISALDADIKALKEDVQRKDGVVAGLESDKSDLDTRLKAADEQKNQAQRNQQQVNSSCTTLTAKVGELTDSVKGLEALIERYRERAETESSRADDAEKARVDSETMKDQKIREINDLNNELAMLKKELLATSVELATYKTHYPPPALKDQPKIDGQITRFDQGTNLVQVNRGKSAGVALGHLFDIVRGDQFICAVIVDRVDDENAVGHIEVHGTNGQPRAGDTATKL